MIGYRKVLIARGATLAMAIVLSLTTGCGKSEPPLDIAKVREFASDYAAAWSSQDPARVASRFAPTGSLATNDGEPAVGREAIAAKVKQVMTDFPDLSVKMDELSFFKGDIDFHWTLTGRNTGPGGTGKAVKFSGYEEWTLAPRWADRDLQPVLRRGRVPAPAPGRCRAQQVEPAAGRSARTQPAAEVGASGASSLDRDLARTDCADGERADATLRSCARRSRFPMR